MRQGIAAAALIGCMLAGLASCTARDGNESSGDDAPARWITSYRVQAHTRLSPRWRDRPPYVEAAQAARILGARVLVRHFKSGEEDPIWPSSVPVGADGRPVLADVADDAAAIIRRANDSGVRLVAYYWFMSDARAAEANPDWVCRRPNGKALDGRRGDTLDITSAYGQLVLTRLMELAQRGVDGFYFDSAHLPLNGCWGTDLARDFVAAGGTLPKRVDLSDADYRSFIEYQSRRVDDTLRDWRAAVQSRYPRVAFMTSVTTVPAMTRPNMRVSLAAAGELPKTEFGSALHRAGKSMPARDYAVSDDVRIAAGWSLLRAAGGGPPAVWAPTAVRFDETEAYVGAVLAHGGIVNLNIDEKLLSVDAARAPAADPWRRLFALGERVQEHLRDARPLRWAGVHFSESARDRRIGDGTRVDDEVVEPVTAVYQRLLGGGVPVEIVTDEMLDGHNIGSLGLLVTPLPRELTPRQQAGAAGLDETKTIRLTSDALPAEGSTAWAALLARAPVRAQASRPGIHALFYSGGDPRRLFLMLTDATTWPVSEPPRGGDPGSLTRVDLNFPVDEVRDLVTGRVVEIQPLPGGARLQIGHVGALRLLELTR